jgi:hypothetical protein
MKNNILHLAIALIVLSLTADGQSEISSASTADNSLVAYYPFNGNANDESGNGNNGVVNGATLTTDRFDNANSAYSFNGTSNYIQVPNSNSLQSPTTAITMAGWIYITGYVGVATAPLIEKTITSNYGQYGLTIHAWNGLIHTGLNPGGGYVVPQSFSLNAWHFIATTWDGNTVKIYVNGIEIGSGTYSTPMTVDNNPLVIGMHSPGSTEYLQGKADDIRIYNRALSTAEIEALYSEDQSLIAYYPFNNNTKDESGNSNDGVALNGASPATDRFGNINSAYQFDGIDDYIEIPNSASVQSPTNKLTIAGWLNIAGYPGLEVAPLVQKSNTAASSQYGFSPQAYDGNLVANLGGTGAAALPYTLSLNSWHFVAYTWDGAIVKFYVDGVEVGAVAYSGTLVPDTQPLTIGFDSSGLSEYLKGKADDIRIYKRALTYSEINDLYHEGNYIPNPPSITSFTPTSGAVGTLVTITGNNFNSNSTDNIVYFGATKAEVISGTTDQLVVIVPAGATYQPFTVTVNGLIAYSDTPFMVTFSCGGEIDANSFLPKVDFTTGTKPYKVAIGDLDGDGKSDIVAANLGSNTISVFRNTTTARSITESSFAPKVDFPTGTEPLRPLIADVDGDGKLDIIVSNIISKSISIFRNSSTLGTLNASSFSSKVDFAIGIEPYVVAIGDIDGDGKSDLVTANFGCCAGTGNMVSVFRNISSPGSITTNSFETKADFTVGNSPYGVAIADVDGDGKQDIVSANASDNTVSVLRNTSTPGSFTASTFAAKVDFPTDDRPNHVSIGDLDGDNKPDLVIGNNEANTISVLRNTTSQGSITASSFAPKVDFAVGLYPYEASIGDMNGDNKPDLIILNNGNNTVSILRNKSAIGSISNSSFEAKVDFVTESEPYGVAIGDLDGDGKPDLVTSHVRSNTVSVFLNNLISLGATFTTSNDWLYFGYSGDQTAIIKATPSGGTGPYTVSISMNRPLICNAISSSGNETWVNGSGTTSFYNLTCPTTGSITGLPTATGNVPSGGYYQVNVTLMQDAILYATITDANGCTVTKEVHIDAEDVRCFAGNSTIEKVTLCHRTGSTKNPCITICVNESAVAEHLAHGDSIGNCTSACTEPIANAKTNSDAEVAVDVNGDVVIDVYPNPIKSTVSVKLSNSSNKNVMMRMMDITGRSVLMIEARSSVENSYQLDTEQLRSGMYFLHVKVGTFVKTVKVLKE